MNMDERVHDAVERYLVSRGWDILMDEKRFFVIYDEDEDVIDIVYYDYVIGLDGWTEAPSRHVFEADLLTVLMDIDHEYIGKQTIGSHLVLRTLGGDRALIRHARNIFERL